MFFNKPMLWIKFDGSSTIRSNWHKINLESFVSNGCGMRTSQQSSLSRRFAQISKQIPLHAARKRIGFILEGPREEMENQHWLVEKSRWSSGQSQSFLLFGKSWCWPLQRCHSYPPCQSKLFGSLYQLATYVTSTLKLADFGEGTSEVVIVKWHVREGDFVDEFSLLCEAQSDKAMVEIKSPFKGRILKRYHLEHESAKIGTPLVDFEVEEDKMDDDPSEENEIKAQEKLFKNKIYIQDDTNRSHSLECPDLKRLDNERDIVKECIEPKSSHILASPAVRRLARQHRIDLGTMQGTGRHQHITSFDIEQRIQLLNESKQTQGTLSQVDGKSSNRIEPLTTIQKAMMRAMTESLTIPHFTYCDLIEMDALMQLRSNLESDQAQLKIGYLPFMIKICSLALNQYPILNASLNTKLTSITYHTEHNIGFAVDTEYGLIVPVIKSVQEKTILQIATEVKRLIALAQTHQLTKDDLQCGTFTLSNIGSIGGAYTTPLIVPPQVCIGAVGKIQKEPRFESSSEEGKRSKSKRKRMNVVPKHVSSWSWSADHRLVDGATMAKFSNLVKCYLEEPSRMILAMK